MVYGRLRVRLVKISDVVEKNFSILRLALQGPHPSVFVSLGSLSNTLMSLPSKSCRLLE